VNVAHLREGTAAENTLDMMLRGRHPGSKLTGDQVREIRDLLGTLSTREIAAIYGVHKDTIKLIRANKIWRWLA
jgi:hypothetical protein